MTVHRLPPPTGDVILTKAQLADQLHRSTRWVEARAAEGMPKLDTDRHGRRRFRLRDVESWLASERPKKPDSLDRIANLDARLQEVERRLGDLEQRSDDEARS
jgi:hypothetical protein